MSQTYARESDPASDSGIMVMTPATLPYVVEDMRRRLGGDERLMADIIAMFVVDCPLRLAQIKIAVEARDAEEIRISAHALKGAAGNLSARPIVQLALALELMAQGRPIDSRALDAAWARLEIEGARLLAALQRASNAGRSLR